MADDAVVRAADPVVLPDTGTEGRLWAALLDVADALPDGWTLVGGLMVFLHAYEAGLPPQRVTADIDVVAAVRAMPDATARLARILTSLGWDLDLSGVSDLGGGHRFVRSDDLAFDVLAPDGLGRNADLTTVPPGEAAPVQGASRALDRTQRIAVSCGRRAGTVPRPDLLGALLIKSRAAVVDRSTDPTRRPERHVEDLAVLYAAASEPPAIREAASAKDLKQLRDAPEPDWYVLGDRQLIAQGEAARRIVVA